MIKLHLVHVGKCAGESLHKALRRHKFHVTAYHCGKSNEALAAAILNAGKQDYFVVPLRDPVSRFVSAFEWDLFEKILSNTGESVPGKWAEIYDRFPTASSLAEALTSQDEDLRTTAQKAMSSSNLHIQMDLEWYLPPYLAAHLNKDNAFGVRVERIDADFRRLMGKLGTSLGANFKVPFTKNNYKSCIPVQRSTITLTEYAKRNIRLYSAGSYETIRVLRKRGVLSKPFLSHFTVR